MPAGLSQITQSNFGRNSSMTRATPSCQCVLVAGLRGGKQEERLDALVANEGLRQLGSSLDDIDEVVDHPAFGPHDQIEVAQAHVEIDHDNGLAGSRQRGTQGGSRGRLADAALPGCHHHDPPHLRHPPVSVECHHPYRVVVEPSLDRPAPTARFDVVEKPS